MGKTSPVWGGRLGGPKGTKCRLPTSRPVEGDGAVCVATLIVGGGEPLLRGSRGRVMVQDMRATATISMGEPGRGFRSEHLVPSVLWLGHRTFARRPRSAGLGTGPRSQGDGPNLKAPTVFGLGRAGRRRFAARRGGEQWVGGGDFNPGPCVCVVFPKKRFVMMGRSNSRGR